MVTNLKHPFRQISLIRKIFRIIALSQDMLQNTRNSWERCQILISWTQTISTSGGILGLMIVIRIMHHIRKNIKLPINSTNRKKKNQFLMDRIPPTRLCRGRFLFRTTIICESFQTIWWRPLLQKRGVAILDKRAVPKTFHHAETIMTSLKRTFPLGISPGM